MKCIANYTETLGMTTAIDLYGLMTKNYSEMWVKVVLVKVRLLPPSYSDLLPLLKYYMID